MRIGLIARNDAGGLAAQSQEFALHLPIAATLLVELGELGRGPSYPFDWPNPIPVQGPNITDSDAVSAFLNQVDVVLSIETFYGDMVTHMASIVGIPTVRYANPELYKYEGETHVVLPTEWERQRIPNATVIPQGVSVQPVVTQIDRPAKTLLHFSAPAMLDRNGSSDFHAALLHTKHSFNVIVVGPKTRDYELRLKHNYEYRSDYQQDRLAIYDNDIDLLVVPRRYGGLCLPMLEAASFGIPILTSDVKPQSDWLHADQLMPTNVISQHNFVGGEFDIHAIDAFTFAQTLDFWAEHSLFPLQNRSLLYAQRFSWEKVALLWNEYLGSI